ITCDEVRDIHGWQPDARREQGDDPAADLESVGVQDRNGFVIRRRIRNGVEVRVALIYRERSHVKREAIAELRGERREMLVGEYDIRRCRTGEREAGA